MSQNAPGGSGSETWYCFTGESGARQVLVVEEGEVQGPGSGTTLWPSRPPLCVGSVPQFTTSCTPQTEPRVYLYEPQTAWLPSGTVGVDYQPTGCLVSPTGADGCLVPAVLHAGVETGNSTLESMRYAAPGDVVVPRVEISSAPEFYALGDIQSGAHVNQHVLILAPSEPPVAQVVLTRENEHVGTAKKKVEISRAGDGRAQASVVSSSVPNFAELVRLTKVWEIQNSSAVARRQGTSCYLGVSRHKKSGRYEAHIWIPGPRKQIYLGGFDAPRAAACAHDIVALKVERPPSRMNFPRKLYQAHENWIRSTGLYEIVSHIKRHSRGFSRGQSRFRGVTQHANGRLEARVGVGAKRHIYLGMYSNEEGAARHYDEAVIRLKGLFAATNFPLTDYPEQVKEHEDMKEVLQQECVDLFNNKCLINWIRCGNQKDPMGEKCDKAA